MRASGGSGALRRVFGGAASGTGGAIAAGSPALCAGLAAGSGAGACAGTGGAATGSTGAAATTSPRGSAMGGRAGSAETRLGPAFAAGLGGGGGGGGGAGRAGGNSTIRAMTLIGAGCAFCDQWNTSARPRIAPLTNSACRASDPSTPIHRRPTVGNRVGRKTCAFTTGCTPVPAQDVRWRR